MNLVKTFGFASAAFVALNFAAPNIHANSVPLEKRVVEYVKESALPAKEFLIGKVKENDIVVLGESHCVASKIIPFVMMPNTKEERLLIEAIPELKGACLKYLALEISADDARCIKEYIQTGVKNEAFRDFERIFIGGTETYVDMIRTAMSHGIEIIPIDDKTDNRDSYMAEKVREVMYKDKDAKMLIHIGSGHAIEERELTEKVKSKLGSSESLARILDEEFGSYSIFCESMTWYLPSEIYATTSPIGFDVDGGPVAELNAKIYFKNYGGAFDGVIVFP